MDGNFGSLSGDQGGCPAAEVGHGHGFGSRELALVVSASGNVKVSAEGVEAARAYGVKRLW